jgi:hypothetical protein
MPAISVSKICVPFSGTIVPMSAGETAIRAGNTVAWYDFTDATTLTDDGGGRISSWRDKLMSGHDLTAAVGARPTLTANGVLFDGAANFMKTAGFVYDQPAMAYIVVNSVTWISAAQFFDGNANYSFAPNEQGASPQISLYCGVTLVPNMNIPINGLCILRFLGNGANSKMQLNNNIATIGDAGTSDPGGITLGSKGDGTGAFGNMNFREAIFRNVVDSAPDEAAIYAYLKAKHGL